MKLTCAKCTSLGRGFWTIAVAALLFAVPGLVAQSQNSQKESLGEAARKARQQKKSAAKPVKVLTEEDLARPPQTTPPSVQNAQASEPRTPGEAPAAAESGQPAPEASATPEASAPSTTEAKVAALEGDLKAAKQELTEAERQLNLAQREFDLRRDQYYSNPDFKSDKKGKTQLDSLQQQVSIRQQEVERLKEKVASLEAERKSLPGAPPPAPAEKPAAPPQP